MFVCGISFSTESIFLKIHNITTNTFDGAKFLDPVD